MSMDYIRKVYKVPAKRGGRVEYTGCKDEGEQGTITGSDGHYLRVRLDGHKEAGNFHPTHALEYLTPNLLWGDRFAFDHGRALPNTARPSGQDWLADCASAAILYFYTALTESTKTSPVRRRTAYRSHTPYGAG